MQSDGGHSSSDSDNRYDDSTIPSESVTQSNRPTQRASIFETPAPLKRLFDRVPLYTYPANPLPIRASVEQARRHRTHTLYTFGSPNQPSLHPTCLRYQTLLTLAGVAFETVTSNNHASPSGSLPFLLTKEDPGASNTIPAAGLKEFARKHAQYDVQLDAKAAHLALLEPIRLAYLAALYLDDETFKTSCAPLYVDTASHSRVVRAALVPPLRAAALDEVLLSTNEAPHTSVLTQLRDWWSLKTVVDEKALYEAAHEALHALSIILEDATWFGRIQKGEMAEEVPGWLDASVFAYTHVFLKLFRSSGSSAEQGMKKRRPLGQEQLHQAVSRHRNLVEHHDRIMEAYG